ncbi:MAG: T9SS type A sorting domain-containing protein, partial [Balneolales bacterium]|nr:T9SS type A sorting domain-containing protein [Balneolales bacterium]
DGASVYDTLTVHITPVNDLPFTVEWPDTLTFTFGDTLYFEYANHFSDVEDDSLELGISVLVEPDGITARIDSAAYVIAFTSAGYTGIGSTEFTVHDSEGGVLETTAVLNVLLGVSDEGYFDIPGSYSLSQNYPNPFNPGSTIQFGLPETAEVTLKVFNMLGQQVATLVNNEKMHAGRHSVQFDARNLASGVYIYRIHAGSFVQTKRMILIK